MDAGRAQVSTSRFWFNYRDTANVLSIYRSVKRLGIPDSNILLMLPDNVACNPRNPLPATVYNDASKTLDLYGSSQEGVEVDYRGYEVTVEAFIRLLTGRHGPEVPRGKRLESDEHSNILFYMTGHGGNDFLKFQDAEEIRAMDLADAFAQMWEKKRYHEILFLIDSCQADSMIRKIYSPNILAVSSAQVGESSYSFSSDADIGVAVMDRFTYFTLEGLERVGRQDLTTMDVLFEHYRKSAISSTPGFRTDLFARNLSATYITDFFGGVHNIELIGEVGVGDPLEVQEEWDIEEGFLTAHLDAPRDQPRAALAARTSESLSPPRAQPRLLQTIERKAMPKPPGPWVLLTSACMGVGGLLAASNVLRARRHHRRSPGSIPPPPPLE